MVLEWKEETLKMSVPASLRSAFCFLAPVYLLPMWHIFFCVVRQARWIRRNKFPPLKKKLHFGLSDAVQDLVERRKCDAACDDDDDDERKTFCFSLVCSACEL